MEKRRTRIAGAIAVGIAAAFSMPSQVAAADGDTGLQFYGHLDLSFDVITKGIAEGGAGNNPPATGKTGWQPDISSKPNT